MKPKISKSIPVPLNEKFLKTVPMVNASGNPIPNNPPLNKDGFWDKPKSTADALKRNMEKVLNERVNRKKGKHK